MKIKFLAITVSLLAAVSIQAQTRYAVQSLTVPSTVVEDTVTNAIGAVIDCRFQPNVAVLINTTGATNATFRFSTSIDGSTWATNQYVIGYGANTAPVPIVTNIAVNGVGWLRLDSIAATGTIAATNSVKYAIKRY